MMHGPLGWKSKRARECEPLCDCGDRGWLYSFNTNTRQMEIQRCDDCQEFDSDDEALKHVVELAIKATDADL